MDDGRIEVRDDGDVRTLVITRPARRNALTADMYGALTEGLRTGDARVVVLAAAGESFCAGNDLDDFMERAGAADDAPVSIDTASPQGTLLHALARLERPLVAAVDGAAIGIGFTTLLHADIVVATPRATFGAPFGLLGLCPEAGSSQLLPPLLGRQRAMEVFLLGRRLDAEEAMAAGLVNRVVPPGALASAAHEYALALAALPEHAVRATRRLVDAPAEPMSARIDRELDAVSACLGTSETRARIAAARARLGGRDR